MLFCGYIFFALTFETKKMPEKRTILQLKIQLCPQISTKIAINLQTARHIYLKRHILISITKEQRTLEKIADFVKKKRSAEPETKLFVLQS